LNRILGDGRLAERLVAAGACRAAHFAMENLAQRYVELYESLT
jgi:hypothetical protein